MIVAILALVAAASSTAIAAGTLANGDGLIKKNSLSGNRLRKHTITGAQVDLTKLGKVPSARNADTAATARHATTADSATTAGTATTAATATNALSLGGIAASGYTQKDCNSTTGQVKGFALVPASASFPSSFTAVSDVYNCSGQAVQAERLGVGDYEVQFLGSPVTIATGNVVDPHGVQDHAYVSFTENGPGDFEVFVYNVVLASPIDRPFSVMIP
jgi:hypothetical protein